MYRTSTPLPLPSGQAITAFQQLAASLELSTQEQSHELLITLERGEIRIGPKGNETLVRVAADNAGDLQMLRDFLSDQIIAHGFTPNWEGSVAGRQPANQSVATVVGVTTLSPSYRRVVIEGPELARFADGGLHFRLLFGPNGADWPVTNEHGVTQWPGGAEAWHRPVYTTRDILCDGHAARLSFDVFVHEGGRVTDWTRRVQPGDEIALTGPGGDTGVRAESWRGFIGDETALPAIARMLGAAPDTLRGEAVIAVPGEDDIQSLPHPDGVHVRWAIRQRGESLLDAVSELRLPASDRHVFFAGEKREAQSARVALMERGLAKGEFLAATYWTKT